MAHNLFGNRFASLRQPAWHGLGTVFQDPIKAVDAVKLANLDYNIIKAPLTASVETPMGTSLYTVPNKVMILREPTSDDPDFRYFGTASADYGLLQNSQVAEILDALTDEWPVETVGALGNGETIFFSLAAGDTDVRGEQLKNFFLVTDTRDGGTSLKIAFTPVRVVCQNTLVTGLAHATISSALPHSAKLEDTFKFRVDLTKKMQKAREMTLETFRQMAAIAITPEIFDRALEAAYPYPKRPAKAQSLEGFGDDDTLLLGDLYNEATQAQQLWEYYCTRADAFRGGARELFGRFNDEFPDTAMTQWAGYNAIVEAEDYREGSDSVPQSAVWGTRAQAKRRAFASIRTAPPEASKNGKGGGKSKK